VLHESGHIRAIVSVHFASNSGFKCTRDPRAASETKRADPCRLVRTARNPPPYATAAGVQPESALSQREPYSRIDSMMGSRSRPFSVSSYSTRGGTSA
jgi:hypothetical protein